ncbi:MAG: prolipoprotein diacylglyceryl transferase [Micavibrio sp.]|nr:prolipoprotein diacylglyceryl transferase [Micavibrio sp.]
MIWEFPNFDPVAIALGPLQIRWYALAYLTGFLLGWKYGMRLAKKDEGLRPSEKDIDDYLPLAIIGVILGGRLGYVLFYNLPYYMDFPLEALKIWEGGMSFHGGTIGVIVSMLLYSAWRKFSFLRLADIVCACVPIGLFFGRIANFINGELYGRPTNGEWGVIFSFAGDMPRHPSQLYEAVLEGAVLFIILNLMIRNFKIRMHEGTVAGAFLLFYGLFRSFVEFFREPDEQIGLIGDWISMGQLLCIPMMLAGLLIMAFTLTRKKTMLPQGHD